MYVSHYSSEYSSLNGSGGGGGGGDNKVTSHYKSDKTEKCGTDGNRTADHEFIKRD